MKWMAIVVVGLATLVAAIAVVGSMLPRAHTASRTLRVRRTPADVWPVHHADRAGFLGAG